MHLGGEPVDLSGQLRVHVWVVAVDQRGIGLSDKPRTGTTPAPWIVLLALGHRYEHRRLTPVVLSSYVATAMTGDGPGII